MSAPAQQPQTIKQAPAAAANGSSAPNSTGAGSGGSGGSAGSAGGCPPHVLEAIYGKAQNKKAAYEASLQRWWTEYADRKNDETEEYVSNSLLYDRRHLPRTAPAPDCVQRAAAAAAAAGASSAAAAGASQAAAGAGSAASAAAQAAASPAPPADACAAP